MKKHLEKKYSKVHDFFSAPPDAEEKAWNIIHSFYHEILTIMKKNKIKQVDIAQKTGKSKSAISKMLNDTPNISIKKMVELADAVGAEINISVNRIKVEKAGFSRISSRRLTGPAGKRYGSARISQEVNN
jgi:transcriptional regulator with XRE-family HTH domain